MIFVSFPPTRSFSVSASSRLRSSLFRRNVRPIESIRHYCKKKQWDPSERSSKKGDVKDFGDLRSAKKKTRESLFDRFRTNKALSVTDITSSEWCEKKVRFSLHHHKPRITDAMKAGRIRHEKLEQEVSKKVKVRSVSLEDIWIEKFMNFIICTKELSMNGLTRELPLLGYVNGIWMAGVIDEIQMPFRETTGLPSLIETKTRSHSTLPAEPQKRNGRLQLMCYKYLWDNVVTKNFQTDKFFSYFGLNPAYSLSEEIQNHPAWAVFPPKTLEDLVSYFSDTCCTLPPAHDHLLVRYEFQGDNSLLGEDHFAYDSVWLKNQIQCSLEFWLGEREASRVPQEERWKCQYCDFYSMCRPSSARKNSTQLR